MSRTLGLTLLLVVLVLVPLSHFVISGPPASTPPGKVKICHFSSGDTIGHVIEVSAAALSAHLNKHGDCEHFVENDGTCRCLPCKQVCTLEYKRCVVDCQQANDPQQCIKSCARERRVCLRACKRETPN